MNCRQSRSRASCRRRYSGTPFLEVHKNHRLISPRNDQTPSSLGARYEASSGSSPIFSKILTSHAGPWPCAPSSGSHDSNSPRRTTNNPYSCNFSTKLFAASLPPPVKSSTPPSRFMSLPVASSCSTSAFLRTLTGITLPRPRRAKQRKRGCAFVKLANLYRSLSLARTIRGDRDSAPGRRHRNRTRSRTTGNEQWAAARTSQPRVAGWLSAEWT